MVPVSYETECEVNVSTRASASGDAYYQPNDIEPFVARLEATARGVTTGIIGSSNQGRPIHAVRVGEGDQVVFLQCGIHANEPTGTAALVHLLTRRLQVIAHGSPGGQPADGSVRLPGAARLELRTVAMRDEQLRRLR